MTTVHAALGTTTPLVPQIVGDYVIRALGASDVGPTLSLFERVFQQHEPVTKHLGLGLAAMKTMTNSAGYRALAEDGLTAIVEHGPSQELVGFRIAGDLARQTSPRLGERFEQVVVRMMDRFPRLTSILGAPFYENLYGLLAYNHLEHVNIDRWLEHRHPQVSARIPRGAAVKMAGIGLLPEHRGYGLGARSTAYVHELARRKGYRWSVVQCTGLYSQQLFESLGYTLYCEIEYDQFRYGKRFPFKGLTSVDGIRPERAAKGYDLDLTRAGAQHADSVP